MPGGERGLDRELARRGVEGRGHRDDHVLSAERRVAAAEARVERLAQVLEVAPRGLDRRDLLDVLGRRQRQDARAPVDRRVRRASSWRSR